MYPTPSPPPIDTGMVEGAAAGETRAIRRDMVNHSLEISSLC